jgi:L-ascorbate peroxidase
VHTNTGGAKGTIRFDKELGHGANAGLENALGLLKPIKEKYPDISWADLIQMASAAGIEAAGGPRIPLRFGRRDAESDSEVPVEGRLPEGDPPYHQADGETPLHAATDNQDHAAHIRRVFYRMGLNDKDIVALSGGHTVGRAHSNRSGANRKEATSYTENGPGTKGGQSWTENWLEFDNRYFTMLKDESEGKTNDDLLKLSTDYVLITDPDFKPYNEAYAADKDKVCEIEHVRACPDSVLPRQLSMCVYLLDCPMRSSSKIMQTRTRS